MSLSGPEREAIKNVNGVGTSLSKGDLITPRVLLLWVPAPLHEVLLLAFATTSLQELLHMGLAFILPTKRTGEGRPIKGIPC